MSEHLSGVALKKWTMMIFLAGDNNLESFAVKDLREMSRVGSSPEVSIVAQLDRATDRVTRRYYVTSPSIEANCVAELDEINTGDPQALLDFVTWAAQTYPAERYALVFWNHGSGWKDTDIYDIAQRQEMADKVTRGQIRGLAHGKGSRALFKSTLKQLLVEAVQGERAILFDDSSADFLDNMELRSVLQRAVEVIGHPIDLIGFDACLMNMLEVDYQIRDTCRVLVGSQETEPGDGWPYDTVLRSLTEHPDMTPEDLGQSIVAAYMDFYQTHFPDLSVTQSAVLMENIELLTEALDPLANLLRDSSSKQETVGLIFSALRAAQRFTDRDYVDIAHFCDLLTRLDPQGAIGEAARQVTGVFCGKASPVLVEGHYGPRVSNAHGMSIYFPSRVLSPLYQRLEFAQRYAWDQFLTAFTTPA